MVLLNFQTCKIDEFHPVHSWLSMTPALFKNKNVLRTLEPQNKAKNKNAEAHFKKQCSYKMKSVYYVLLCRNKGGRRAAESVLRFTFGSDRRCSVKKKTTMQILMN